MVVSPFIAESLVLSFRISLVAVPGLWDAKGIYPASTLKNCQVETLKHLQVNCLVLYFSAYNLV